MKVEDLSLGWYLPKSENVKFYEINITETQISSLKYFPQRTENPSDYVYIKSNIAHIKNEINNFYNDWNENEKNHDIRHKQIFHIPFSVENEGEESSNGLLFNPIDKNDPDSEFIQSGYYCLILQLSNNRINSLDSIDIFCDLRSINLSNNYIRDIHQIIECPFLQKINMDNNKIEDISCLKELIYLDEIHFSHNEIKEFICENYDLEVIDLSYNSINEIDIMSKTLKMLDLSYNPLLQHNVYLKKILDCVNIKELKLNGINEYIIKENETGITDNGVTLIEIINEILSKLKGLISFEIDSDRNDFIYPKHMKYLNGYNI